MSLEDAATALNASQSQMLQYETTLTPTVPSLVRLCKLYDITPNEILGFDIAGAPSPQGLQAWIPAAEISADLPDGYYSLLYLYKNAEICGMDDLPIVNCRLVFRKNGVWLSLPGNVKLNFIGGNERLIAAMAIPAPPEGYTLFLKQPEGGEDSA